jgi:hypothetical protein
MGHVISIIIVAAVATSAAGAEYFKYTDQNGIVFWLEDKSKIPPPMSKQYRYEDKNGITFWVDNASKIPPEYRNKVTPDKEDAGKPKAAAEQMPVEMKQSSTRISIVNNQIIVPVVFRNNGRVVRARMILDTGASVTTIYSTLASELNLNKNKLTTVKSISANGAYTDSLLTKVDLIEIDDQLLANTDVVIMPIRSNIGADGLLGNSFLRFFNFTIDYGNRLIRWK